MLKKPATMEHAEVQVERVPECPCLSLGLLRPWL